MSVACIERVRSLHVHLLRSQADVDCLEVQFVSEFCTESLSRGNSRKVHFMSDQTPFNPYSQPASGQMGTGGSRPNIPNHLVKAIISTLCCCLPFGIVAIVFAAQVNGKLDAGDYAGAQKASQEANKWGNISIGIGVVVNLLVVVGQILIAMAAAQGQPVF